MPKRLFAFESKAWQECIEVHIELNKIYRQTDHNFIHMLNEIRRGICTPESERMLLSCANRTFDQDDGIEPTRLYSTNRHVNQLNEEMLIKLEGKGKQYKAQDRGKATWASVLDKCIPDVIKLKIGTIFLSMARSLLSFTAYILF